GSQSLRDCNRLPGEFETARIERLREKRLPPGKQQVARRREEREGARLQQGFRRLLVERADEDRAGLLTGSPRRVVKEVTAVGQERRPAMRLLLSRGVENRDRRRIAACRAYSIDSTLERRREHDGSVGTPGAAPAVDSDIRDDLRSTADEIDRLQLARGDESERAGIRRPERLTGSFGSRQRTGDERIERPQPERAGPIGRGRREGQQTSVRRNR